MTLRYHDGFDYLPIGQSAVTVERLLLASHYYIARDVNGGTPQVGGLGRFDFGRCLRVVGTVAVGFGGYKVVRPIDPEGGSVYAAGFLGFALYVSSNTLASWPWIGFYDAVSDQPQVTVRIAPNGVLHVYRGYPSGGTFLGSTQAGALTWDAWARIEFGCEIDNAAGTFEIRINTRPVITLASQDTQFTAIAGFDSYAFGCQSQGGIDKVFDFYLDDLCFNDDAGAVNNSFLGNVRVKTQFAAGAGAHADFTPVGAATNWQAMLNTVMDDTKYAAGTTAGDYDLVAIEAILGSQAVLGVQVRSGMRQDDATQVIGHNLFQLSGGSLVEFAGDHYTDQTFTYYTDIQELDPDSGLGMTGTDVNAAQIGPKKVSP